ncbi:uncharacterized protein LOC107509365 isoform X2 [Rousettus aegyptiacus]|uniref:uncharacterized protein LOC107509365 isoform X2 n=1 Tax=Rousettus aegyptiacus TaxID=9407 RepID=UPI00168D4D36|nr:uncharacterized protein LOC107509365 isoform X2 [Rousettus aegyptiacus]
MRKRDRNLELSRLESKRELMRWKQYDWRDLTLRCQLRSDKIQVAILPLTAHNQDGRRKANSENVALNGSDIPEELPLSRVEAVAPCKDHVQGARENGRKSSRPSWGARRARRAFAEDKGPPRYSTSRQDSVRHPKNAAGRTRVLAGRAAANQPRVARQHSEGRPRELRTQPTYECRQKMIVLHTRTPTKWRGQVFADSPPITPQLRINQFPAPLSDRGTDLLSGG